MRVQFERFYTYAELTETPARVRAHGQGGHPAHRAPRHLDLPHFKYHPKMVVKGGDVDWIYDHLGAYAWVTEFWSPQRAAGISDYHFIDWLRDHSPEDELC